MKNNFFTDGLSFSINYMIKSIIAKKFRLCVFIISLLSFIPVNANDHKGNVAEIMLRNNLDSLKSVKDLVDYPWIQDTIISRTDMYNATNRQGKVIHGIHDYVPNWLPNNPKNSTTCSIFTFSPTIEVTYQMSPSDAEVYYEDLVGYDVSSYSAERLGITSPMKDSNGKYVFKTYREILTAGLRINNPQFLNCTPTNFADTEEYDKIALKINTYVNYTDKKEIVSNYVPLKGTKYWVEALVWAKKPMYAAGSNKNRLGDELGIFNNNLYGLRTTTQVHVASKVHVWDSPEEALSDPDGAALELYYNDEKGIQISQYLGLHLVHNDTETGRPIISTLMNGGEKKYGLSYEFNLIDYSVEGSYNHDSKYADWGMIGSSADEIEAAKAKGLLVARNYLKDGVTIDTESATAIDREPLVQVLVKNNEGEVLLDGYILVHITRPPTADPDNLHIDNYPAQSTQFDLNNGRGVFSSKWSDFSNYVLTQKLNNMTKEDFDANYEPDLLDKGIGFTADGGTIDQLNIFTSFTKNGNAIAKNNLGIAKYYYYPNRQDANNLLFTWELSAEELDYLTKDKPAYPIELSKYIRFKEKTGLSQRPKYPYIFIKMTIILTRKEVKGAYAVLSTDNTTLSFYYDGKKNKREGTVYELNAGKNNPGWVGNGFTKVVFDTSFTDARPTTTYNWFCKCDNLTKIEGINNLRTDDVTNMAGMFYYCSGLTTLDVSNFNTGNVTNMSSMFSGCSGLTTLNVSGFDTGNVTDMHSMFDHCSGLTTLDVSGIDTGNVTNMGYMFYGCSSLTTLDVSNFNTSNVTHMYGMFSCCSGLTTLDVSNFNTGNVKYMNNMFSGCSGLTTLDVSNFNTGNVAEMVCMFEDCSRLTTLDLSGFDTGNVIDMSEMFNGCSCLTTLDLSGFDTGNVKHMGCMFSCSGLTTIYCGDNWNTEKVKDSSDMFTKSTNLIGGAGTKYDDSHTDKEYAHVDGGPSNPGYFTYKGEGGEEDGDDLQRYLDSLVDTEDDFTNNVYRRVFLNDEWQALYVPFEMNYSDWADKFEVADIYGFYWYDDDDDNYVDRQELVATIVESGSLQANFPYLIRAKSKTGGTLSVNVSGDVSNRITVAYMEIPPVTYSFVGNYSQLTGLMSAERFRLQGGSLFIPLSDSEVLLPYRWYMNISVGSTQSVRLNIVTDSESTGIEKVKKSELIIHNSQLRPQVYDLSGRRVTADAKSLPKGIYIINNKKCIVK